MDKVPRYSTPIFRVLRKIVFALILILAMLGCRPKLDGSDVEAIIGNGQGEGAFGAWIVYLNPALRYSHLIRDVNVPVRTAAQFMEMPFVAIVRCRTPDLYRKFQDENGLDGHGSIYLDFGPEDYLDATGKKVSAAIDANTKRGLSYRAANQVSTVLVPIASSDCHLVGDWLPPFPTIVTLLATADTIVRYDRLPTTNDMDAARLAPQLQSITSAFQVSQLIYLSLRGSTYFGQRAAATPLFKGLNEIAKAYIALGQTANQAAIMNDVGSADYALNPCAYDASTRKNMDPTLMPTPQHILPLNTFQCRAQTVGNQTFYDYSPKLTATTLDALEASFASSISLQTQADFMNPTPSLSLAENSLYQILSSTRPLRVSAHANAMQAKISTLLGWNNFSEVAFRTVFLNAPPVGNVMLSAANVAQSEATGTATSAAPATSLSLDDGEGEGEGETASAGASSGRPGLFTRILLSPFTLAANVASAVGNGVKSIFTGSSESGTNTRPSLLSWLPGFGGGSSGTKTGTSSAPEETSGAFGAFRQGLRRFFGGTEATPASTGSGGESGASGGQATQTGNKKPNGHSGSSPTPTGPGNSSSDKQPHTAKGGALVPNPENVSLSDQEYDIIYYTNEIRQKLGLTLVHPVQAQMDECHNRAERSLANLVGSLGNPGGTVMGHPAGPVAYAENLHFEQQSGRDAVYGVGDRDGSKDNCSAIYGTDPSVDAGAGAGWCNHQGHAQNLKNPSNAGIGAAVAANGQHTVWCQDFSPGH